MAIPIKSTSAIAEKFARVTPGRAQDFADGVQNPRRDWKTETAAAESRYEAGVTEAIQGKRFGKGVSKAGTEKWQRATLSLGVTRWPEGVQGAGPAYEAGFGPFRDVIAGLNLPQKFARGDSRNILRVAAIAKALHTKKIGG